MQNYLYSKCFCPTFPYNSFYKNLIKPNLFYHEGIPYTTVEKYYNPGSLKLDSLGIKILYSHGNANDIFAIREYLIALVDYFISQFVNYEIHILLVAYEYPTFGIFQTNEYELSAPSLYNISSKMWDFLIKKEIPQLKDSNYLPIDISIGYSIGCAMASCLLTHCTTKPNIILLLAPYSTIPGGAGYTNFEYFYGPLFDVNTFLTKAHFTNVLLLFGKDDTVLPYEKNKEITKHKNVYTKLIQGDHDVFFTDMGIHETISILFEQVMSMVEQELPNSKHEFNLQINDSADPETSIVLTTDEDLDDDVVLQYVKENL